MIEIPTRISPDRDLLCKGVLASARLPQCGCGARESWIGWACRMTWGKRMSSALIVTVLLPGASGAGARDGKTADHRLARLSGSDYVVNNYKFTSARTCRGEIALPHDRHRETERAGHGVNAVLLLQVIPGPAPTGFARVWRRTVQAGQPLDPASIHHYADRWAARLVETLRWPEGRIPTLRYHDM